MTGVSVRQARLAYARARRFQDEIEDLSSLAESFAVDGRNCLHPRLSESELAQRRAKFLKEIEMAKVVMKAVGLWHTRQDS